MTFEETGISDALLASIDRMGFNNPTLIQERTIPHIMSGKDLIGESATGSGKTLAFGCGVIEHVQPGQGLQALVLTPTRELAEQVMKDLKKLSNSKNLSIISIYGGVSINPQIEQLVKGEVVVATPGRLLDHIGRKTIDLNKVKILVLDEADRMFDMGFIDDVEEIIRHCPNRKQNLFFSATISERVRELAEKHMRNPIEVSATKQVDPKKLEQIYYDVPKQLKLSLLAHIINQKAGLNIVFCNTRRSTSFVTKNLKANNISALEIHGGLTQNKRSRTIELFNKAKADVLVCTDVAARGLHIANVARVINFDIPKDPKDYVHRIGRTARAGNEGKAINLLCDMDYENFDRVLQEYREFNIKNVQKPNVQKIKFVMEKKARPNYRQQSRKFYGKQRR